MIFCKLAYVIIHNIITYLTPVFQGPVLSSNVIPTSVILSVNSPTRAKESDLQLPLWMRSAAKLLNGGADGQDWLALAKRLGKSLCC